MAYITNPKTNNRFAGFTSRRGNIESRNSSRKIFYGFLLGILFILGFFIFGNNISPQLFALFSPAIKVYNSLKTNVSYGFKLLTPKSSLVSKNIALENQVNELLALNSAMDSVIQENILLKESIGKNVPGFQPTYIISMYPQTPFDTLLIDKGEASGLRMQEKVFLSEKIAIGEIEIVSLNQSRVRLFSSSGIQTEALIERTGEIINVLGQGGGAFKVELPRNFDITEGDMLLLPGGDRFVLSRVVSIKTTEGSPFLNAYMQLPIRIRGDSTLYVQNR